MSPSLSATPSRGRGLVQQLGRHDKGRITRDARVPRHVEQHSPTDDPLGMPRVDAERAAFSDGFLVVAAEEATGRVCEVREGVPLGRTLREVVVEAVVEDVVGVVEHGVLHRLAAEERWVGLVDGEIEREALPGAHELRCRRDARRGEKCERTEIGVEHVPSAPVGKLCVRWSGAHAPARISSTRVHLPVVLEEHVVVPVAGADVRDRLRTREGDVHRAPEGTCARGRRCRVEHVTEVHGHVAWLGVDRDRRLRRLVPGPQRVRRTQVRAGDEVELAGLGRRAVELDADRDARAEHRMPAETAVAVPRQIRQPGGDVGVLDDDAHAVETVDLRFEALAAERGQAAQAGIVAEAADRGPTSGRGRSAGSTPRCRRSASPTTRRRRQPPHRRAPARPRRRAPRISSGSKTPRT